MPEFRTGTGLIFYEVIDAGEGTRPTLTLLHNFMSSGRAAWGPMVEDLARDFRVLLPDLPGHGQSIGYPSGFQHTMMAEQIADLMVAEGATAGHIAGCSSGGMITQLLVHQGLIDPQSVTLVSTTYTVDPAKLAGSRAPLRPDHFQAGRRWMDATARLHDPYHYDGYYEEVLLAGFRKLDPQSAIDLPLESFAGWEMPVCLIHGEQDEFFPVTVPERMATTLPHAELNVVPRQSHALIFRRPWQVHELMEAFYAKNRFDDRTEVPYT